jgi:hypothetical protein
MTAWEPAPEVLEIAERCVNDVREELGFDLDFTVETLPVLDHYCRNVRRGNRWPDGAELLAQSTGAYFGEVIRRRYHGVCRWHISALGGYAWRLEFLTCFLCFNPIGSALELLLETRAHGWNADLVTHVDVVEDLQAKLEGLPGVAEDDYYTLSVRSEVIETVFDFLEAWERSRRDDDEPPPRYRSSDYEQRIAELEADMVASFEEN